MPSGTQLDPVVVEHFIHIARAEAPAVSMAVGDGDDRELFD